MRLALARDGRPYLMLNCRERSSQQPPPRAARALPRQHSDRLANLAVINLIQSNIFLYKHK